MHIEVQPYNPQWPTDFLTIKFSLQAALQGIDLIAIEHIGSTSIPGMAAKPIIDIDLVVSPRNLDAATHALVSNGGYENMGEWGVKGRIAFRKVDAVPRRNVYVCLDGCVGFRSHVALREACRGDEGVRDAYSMAKMRLAEKEWGSVDEYGIAKNEVVLWILGKAGLSEADLKEIAEQNET